MAVIFEDLLYTVADYIGRHEDIDASTVTVQGIRPISEDATGFYNVTLGADTAELINLSIIDWNLTVVVTIGYDAGSRDQTEAGIRQVFANREKVHKQIMQELRKDKLGQGYIKNVEPEGGSGFITNPDLSSNFMVYTTDWLFEVRTNSISTLEITP